MNQNKADIFDRMLAGGLIPFDDPEYPKIFEAVSNTIRLSVDLNTSTNIDQIRERLSDIIGRQIDESTTFFTPFHTNFGRHIQIGKNVFINHACDKKQIFNEIPTFNRIDQHGLNYLICSVTGWVDLFSRQVYREIFFFNRLKSV